MKSNREKKGVLNNVFVYILSIIIVVFCGFLVTKFVLSFSEDAKTATQNKVFNSLEEDFKQVYIKYGAENVNNYRLASEVEYICFVEKTCEPNLITTLNSNQKTSLNTIMIGGDNVALFDGSDIITSSYIGDFHVKDSSGCLCIKPNNDRLNLIFTNEKNIVWINDNS